MTRKSIFKQGVMLLIALFSLNSVTAQNRITQTINTNWNFFKGNIEDQNDFQNPKIAWEKISIPHSWNTEDVMDDTPGYYRGVGTYRKEILIPSSWKERDIYIHFEGASQVTELFVNGKKVGKHIGGYSQFNFPIKQYLQFDQNKPNVILVKVDNSHNEDIPPLSADFTFFGGIYRDVQLVALDPVHLDMDNYASTGVFITTPKVSAEEAQVYIRGAFVNNSKSPRRLQIVNSLINPEGLTVKQQKSNFRVKANEKINFTQQFADIKKPELWSPENPNLYTIVTTVVDISSGKQLDQVSNPVGFRWFNFDAAKGFFLNGKPYKLIGASRHQDFMGMAHSLPDAMHIRDVKLLKEMGGNFLRVAHYPQDPAVLQACDRLGLLASVEIPIVNRITETEAFSENAKLMQMEMIRQHYNHPSLIIWAYMNEVLLRPRFIGDKVRQDKYYNNIAKLAQELEDLTKKEDPSRYTLIPNHGSLELYNRVGLTRIPDLVGWNLYKGWYSGKLEDFGKFLDEHHKILPDKPLLITEYGADADERIRSFDPIRFDKSVEYTNRYHEVYLKAMMDRPFVAAAMIWNLSEFNSEERSETQPHINNKGLLTLDRRVKDPYLFYQAHLLKSPFLKIASRNWTLRSGISEEGKICNQPLEVFSNQPEVTLWHNGKMLSTAKVIYGKASFTVPFIDGMNKIEAVTRVDGTELRDGADINFLLIPRNLKDKDIPFTEINVTLGDKRIITESKLQQVWLPEQPYEIGSWGYMGGEIYAMKNKSRQSYGTDKNILGTELDPVYATQRVGIKEFKLDVPDGKYAVTLHFAELVSDKEHTALAYNLDQGDGTNKDKATERAFDVLINNEKVLEGLSNANYLEPEYAFSSKFEVEVRNGKGIVVGFKPIKGEPVLNGIQVLKIY